MATVKLTPLRSWEDFFPGSDRFAKPDGKDLSKWNNRVVSNLLYYQTNYLLISIGVFLLVGLLNPFGMCTVMLLVSGLFRCSLWVGENRAVITNFKRQNPTAFFLAVMVASYVLISMLGSAMTFVNAVILLLALIFAHASLNLPNMWNEMELKAEEFGLKRSPMGILLLRLGQKEKYHKVLKLLEKKPKE